MCSQEGGVVAGHQKTKNPRALYVRGREGICAPESVWFGDIVPHVS